MSLFTPLRTPRKRFRLPIMPVLSAGLFLAALILLGYNLFHFAGTRGHGGAEITVGGVEVGGLDVATARQTWESVYSQPVELDYGGSPILLNPALVGFQIDSDSMAAQFKTASGASRGFWSDFWGYLWQHQGSVQASIDLSATYDQNKLRQFLQDIAVRYQRTGNNGGFDLTTMTFGAGTAGRTLDVEAAMPLVDAALRAPSGRQVQLPLKTVGASNVTLDAVKAAIQTFLTNKPFPSDGPDTFVSIMLIDLKSGQEMALNPDVAYAAESTIKIPILVNMFRTLKDTPPSTEIKWLMGASILCSNDDASNSLIRYSSNKPAERDQYIEALQQINATVATLGIRNTYINAPIYTGDKNLVFSIPAPKTQPDKRFDTKPDPFSQTTASDMATLLEDLYDCGQYGSGLIAAFPDDFTQKTCNEMIELLSGNKLGRLIELGVPPGTRVARKNGWGGNADMWHTSDAAIVYTPGGNYVLSIYTAERLKPGYQQGDIISWETIEGISRIVYNYFNPDKPLLEARQPDHPTTANNCVMPNPNHPETLSLENINNGRYDASGNILPDACENYPNNPACFTKQGG